MTWLYVALGAAVGAPLRYLTDRFVQSRHDSVFPWGTFSVNVVGCFVLGLVAGSTPLGSTVGLLVGTGFCGALTTYSTFSYETLRLTQTGARMFAATNLAVSLTAGVAATYIGLQLAS